MSCCQRRLVCVLAIGIVTLLMTARVHAKPGFAGSCNAAGCHTHSRDSLSIEGYDTTTDLGHGNLKTFIVSPDVTALFNFRVSDGHDDYAISLQGFDDPGVVSGSTLDFSINLGSEWNDEGSYYVSDKHGTNNRTYTLSMNVAATTPPDYYYMEVQLAGKNGGKWADVENFYLQVLGSEPVEPITLVGAGSQWLYNDTAADLGTAWRDPGYADGGWDSGDAELGYGNTNTVTTLDYGDPNDKYPTTYFRKSFTVTAEDLANIQHLSLQLVRDDGAAVYINGTEVRRDNLDPHAAYGTYAESNVSGDAENTFYETLFVPGALLHVGDDNLIAVETHQAAPDSADLGMDLALFAYETPFPYGEVTPEISTGFEEASDGDQSFARGPGDTELAWSITGSDTTTAEVTDRFNDPANLHQFELSNIDDPLQLTTEKIDVAGHTDLLASIDLRTFVDSDDFENDDTFAVSLSTSTDGLTFTTTPWLQLDGGELNALNNGQNGAFESYTSDEVPIPDDVVSMRLVIDAEIDSGNEHMIFDNLVVSGTPVAEIYRLTWDGGGDGQWADVDGGTGKSRWLDAGDNPHLLFPRERRTYAVVKTDTVTVAADRGARTLTVEDGGTIAVADGATLDVFKSTDFKPGTKLVLGQNARLIAGADGGTLDSVDAGPGATIDGDVLVTGTLAPSGSTGMVTIGEGQMTLAHSATYAAEVSLTETAAGVIEVSAAGSLHLGGTLTIAATDRADADSWATGVSRTIVNSPSGAVTGAFAAVVPTPATDATSHVGQGAFLRHVSETAGGVDVTLFIALGGDADGDGKVWLSDWAALRANFGNTATGKAWTDGNFDPWLDDKVWLSDWAALRASFGNSDYTAGAAAAVPEPGAIAMLLGAMLALAGAWIRKNSVVAAAD